MSTSSSYRTENGPSTPNPTYDPNPPTVAAFSPTTLSGASLASKQRSTIIVHKKSPLLVATPPQVTRALAYSHPFLLPLNKLAGLLSWSSGDPWESFLLVAAFWAIVLYGDNIIRWAGPILVVVGLILGMYSRRYSPLSSTSLTGEKLGHKREPSEGNARHYKSLDEIVDTLRTFTTRCNILMEPLLRLTDFLSTQRTATSATTRPALTALFIRILLVTPIWILLTLPPLYLLTTRRVVLTSGTLLMTWHSRPARVSRVILWRSLTVRKICSVVTGLSFSESPESHIPSTTKPTPPSLPPRSKNQANIAPDLATKRRADSSGVRFTFILYENQRRWLGIGWTYSLLAYERAAWTDENLNTAPSKDDFELPDVEGGHARWRWVEGSEWRIEGADGASTPSKAVKGGKDDSKTGDGGGWIYYDNKWNDGRRGVDSWGRYTRRRKWYRDAELVEVTPSTEITPSPTPNTANAPADTAIHSDAEDAGAASNHKPIPTQGGDGPPPEYAESAIKDDDSPSVKARKKGWFGSSSRRRRDSESSKKADSSGKMSVESARTDPEDDHHDKWSAHTRDHNGEKVWARGLGDEASMGFS